MSVTQTSFRSAILNADLEVPQGLLNAKQGPAGSRFSVYRNNVILSLIEAMKTAFPLIYRLLGEKTFADLAAIYVRKHPPTSPLMMFYGAELPDFLRTFQPLAHLGYLSDCARLDCAMRRSYHAADTDPVDLSVFQGDPTRLMSTHFALRPATQVLRSQWPLYDIWRVNFEEDAPRPTAVPQDIVITRPEFDPKPHALLPGGADWLELLEVGVAFGDAHEQTMSTTPDFDLAAALSQALQIGALTEYNTKDS